MGTFEVAWQFGLAVTLDNAAFQASRFGALGRVNADGTRAGSSCEAAVKAAAVKAGKGLLLADRLTVTPTQFARVVDLDESGKGKRGTGVGGSFVEYRQPLVAASKLFGKSEITHVATTTVVNEPYPDASKPTPC
jgi:hypothetical protein